MILTAPAKLNLCLYVGPRRADGLHEIVSLLEPISLADRIEVSEAERDEVVCADVQGANLASRALGLLREGGLEGPGLRVEIEKRIPVAAGLGGGSADAAAVLRLGNGAVEEIEEAAAKLGADVPSQLRPHFSLVRGAGERVKELPPAAEHAVVLLPHPEGLATADVFTQADRMGIRRDEDELRSLATALRAAAGAGASPLDYAELLVNDLERAAQALRPRIGEALEALRAAGAARALVTGSGPTAFGLFSGGDEAEAAAARLGPPALACLPVTA